MDLLERFERTQRRGPAPVADRTVRQRDACAVLRLSVPYARAIIRWMGAGMGEIAADASRPDSADLVPAIRMGIIGRMFFLPSGLAAGGVTAV